jgi:hypothetical protein
VQKLLLLIFSCLMISFFSFLRSNTRFFAVFALKLLKSNKTFKDSHIIVTCILRLFRSRIKTYNLINCNASDFSFINEKFAQTHQISLHLLKYFRRLDRFDDQRTLFDNITHVIEVIMNLSDYVEKIFLYVIKLKNYSIILNHSWLRRHNVIADFENNTLIFVLFFYLNHCCSHFIKLQVIEKEFLISVES